MNWLVDWLIDRLIDGLIQEVPELTTPEKVKAEKRKQGDANVAAKKIKLNGQVG